MSQLSRFHDRTEAGRRLAVEVGRRFGIPTAVAAISTGGGLVALSIARAFARPLVFTYCAPLRLPWRDGGPGEFGAVDEDGRAVLDYPTIAATRISDAEIQAARDSAGREVEGFYGIGYFPRLDELGPVPRLLLVDEGLDPGWRMEAAMAMARRRRVSRVLVAAPCASRGTSWWFELDADGFVALCVDDQPTPDHYEVYAAVSAESVGVRVPRLRGKPPALSLP